MNQSRGQVVQIKKYHCYCMMESGEELYIAVQAKDEADASRQVHEGYAIEYVLEIYTPLQMEYRKRHLRRGIQPGTQDLLYGGYTR